MRMLWLSLALGLSAVAKATPPAPTDPVKFSGDRMNLDCFHPDKKTSDQKLKDLNFKIDGNLSADSKDEVPAILSRIQDLAGKDNLIKDVVLKVSTDANPNLSKCQGTHIRAKDDQPETIELNPNCPTGMKGVAAVFEYNMGQVVESKLNLYKSYNQTKPCNISKFAEGKIRGVEFAEVFSSYLSSPNALEAQCPDTFKWMKDNVFPKGDAKKDCTSSPARSAPPVASAPAPNSPAPTSTPQLSPPYKPKSATGAKNGVGDQLDSLLPILAQLAQQNQSAITPQPPAHTLTPITTIYVGPAQEAVPWGSNNPFVAH